MPRGEQIAKPAEWDNHAAGFVSFCGRERAQKEQTQSGGRTMTWNWSARVTGLAILTTVGALSTCKEDSAGPSSGKTPIELARGTIGTAGGQLKGSDGRFVLQVPPGALPSPTEIVVNQLADASSFSAG